MSDDSGLDTVERGLSESLVAEIMDVLGEIRPPVGCEVQLFGYFPLLKLQTLFGSVLIQENRPQKVTPLGPSNLLVLDDLPDEKLFYPYVVVREPCLESIKYSYLFPTDDSMEIKSIEMFDETPVEFLLEIEAGILGYALEWADVFYE